MSEPSSSPPTPLGQLLRDLDAAGVSAVICGGVACNIHGVDRVTHDLDLSLAFDHENLDRFVTVVERHGLRPRVPEPIGALRDAERRRVWVEEKRAVVFTLQSDDGRMVVDVFLDYPVSHEALVRDGMIPPAGSGRLRVSSIPHLIAAKHAVKPPREKDQRDIADLNAILKDGEDV